jgi:leucyl/phenylalanyl-tRNA--protein transferase
MRLTTELLLAAYCQGIFPMGLEDGDTYWFDPDPRAILPLDAFHVPRRLARTIRNTRYRISIDTSFDRVIQACAEPTPTRKQTWINAEIKLGYERLHQAGFAHSVEVWLEEEMVGGLYGVAIRGLFAGESMFNTAPEASKVALVSLVNRLQERGYRLLDIQFMTEHLRQFGAIEISRAEYKRRLALALGSSTRFHRDSDI